MSRAAKGPCSTKGNSSFGGQQFLESELRSRPTTIDPALWVGRWIQISPMPRRLDKINRHFFIKLPNVSETGFLSRPTTWFPYLHPAQTSIFTYSSSALLSAATISHPHSPSQTVQTFPKLNHIIDMSSSSSSTTSDGMSPLLIATIVLTLLAAIAGAVYMSGAADDMVHYAMEKYFKAEAKASEKVLEKSGEKYAEGFL